MLSLHSDAKGKTKKNQRKKGQAVRKNEIEYIQMERK